MLERTEELKQRVRETPLNERLEGCRRRIGAMCSEGRPPRMCIPVQHDDDDFYISTTLADAQQTVERLERENECKDTLIETLQAQLAATQQQVAQLRENAEAATKIYTRLLQSMTDWMARLKPDHHPMYKRGVEEVIASAFNGVNLDSSPVLMSDWQKQQVQFAQLHTAHTTLRGLVEKLPVVKTVEIRRMVDEYDYEEWCVWTDGNPLADCETFEHANGLKGLLEYRAALPREGAITSDGGEHDTRTNGPM